MARASASAIFTRMPDAQHVDDVLLDFVAKLVVQDQQSTDLAWGEFLAGAFLRTRNSCSLARSVQLAQLPLGGLKLLVETAVPVGRFLESECLAQVGPHLLVVPRRSAARMSSSSSTTSKVGWRERRPMNVGSICRPSRSITSTSAAGTAALNQ